jgi:hypothetical protein
MKKNVGRNDRMGRLVLGIAIIAAGVYFSSLFGLIGLVIMIPAVLGSDPLYNVFGIDTNQSK